MFPCLFFHLKNHLNSIFSSSILAVLTSSSVRAPSIILCFLAWTCCMRSSTVSYPLKCHQPNHHKHKITKFKKLWCVMLIIKLFSQLVYFEQLALGNHLWNPSNMPNRSNFKCSGALQLHQLYKPNKPFVLGTYWRRHLVVHSWGHIPKQKNNKDWIN